MARSSLIPRIERGVERQLVRLDRGVNRVVARTFERLPVMDRLRERMFGDIDPLAHHLALAGGLRADQVRHEIREISPSTLLMSGVKVHGTNGKSAGSSPTTTPPPPPDRPAVTKAVEKLTGIKSHHLRNVIISLASIVPSLLPHIGLAKVSLLIINLMPVALGAALGPWLPLLGLIPVLLAANSSRKQISRENSARKGLLALNRQAVGQVLAEKGLAEHPLLDRELKAAAASAKASLDTIEGIIGPKGTKALLHTHTRENLDAAEKEIPTLENALANLPFPSPPVKGVDPLGGYPHPSQLLDLARRRIGEINFCIDSMRQHVAEAEAKAAQEAAAPPPPAKPLSFTAASGRVYEVVETRTFPKPGGMAVIYVVKDQGSSQIRALKLYSPPLDVQRQLDADLSRRDEYLARFGQEIAMLRALASLNDPHIVRFFDDGSAEGKRFYIMEFVPASIADPEVINSLDAETAIDIIIQTAQGLRAALGHSERIVHRDVKPGNILLERDPGGKICAVKLADFGLGKPLESSTDLTMSGAIMGTPAYIAPEVVERGGWKKVSAQTHLADIYSLGITFYRILCKGDQPFVPVSLPQSVREVKNWAKMMRAAIAGVARPKSMSPEIFAVIMKMIDADPAKRYQTYDELIAALEGLKSHDESSSLDLHEVGEQTAAELKMPPVPREALLGAKREGDTTVIDPSEVVSVAGLTIRPELQPLWHDKDPEGIRQLLDSILIGTVSIASPQEASVVTDRLLEMEDVFPPADFPELAALITDAQILINK